MAQYRECYDLDVQHLHLAHLCHAEEAEEVRAALWELYPRYYEAYAIFAGRSQWPLVRHVDVYSFFDEARLLDRGEPAAALPPLDVPSTPTGGQQTAKPLTL